MPKFKIEQRRYLGNKSKLLDFIAQTISKENIKYESFCDLFAGTGVVGANQLLKNKKVFLNDMLYSNFVVYNGFFGLGEVNENKLQTIINNWKEAKIKKENYFSKKFGNKYFTKSDSIKLGYCREELQNLFQNKNITEREFFVLLSSLIYSMDKIALTVGHYDAFRENATKVAKKLKIELIDFQNNKNVVLINEDANLIARNINADIVYIDPPYNSRQYGDAYHLLENYARWNKPETFGKAEKMDRNSLKSEYSLSSAKIAFETLINSLNSKYIIISYNDTGVGKDINSRSAAKITDKEIIRILKRRGNVSIHEMNYKAFNTGKTSREVVMERLFVCRVSKKSIYTENVKSPLNYSGGKFGIIEQIKSLLPKNIEKFYDLFAGALNVGVNIEVNQVIAFETQKELVDLLKYIKSTPTIELITRIEKNIKKYNLSNTFANSYREYSTNSSRGLSLFNKFNYEIIRNDYNKNKNIELLLMLVIYGFNNMIRFNAKGDFNTPVGKRDFNNNVRSNLIAFSERIKDVVIQINNQSYQTLKISEVKNNDFLFLDPPYWITDAVYNKTWSESDEIHLYQFLENAIAHKIKFMLTNILSTPDRTNIHLKDFISRNNLRVVETKNTFSNSSYNKKQKGHSKEIIVMNY